MTTVPDRRFFLRKTQKLRAPQEFERVYDGKQKAGDDRLLVFAARRPGGVEPKPDGPSPSEPFLSPTSSPSNSPDPATTTRFGLSVSRKHGGAVRRARLKRLLREAFRRSQHDLPPGLDLVLIPRQGVAAGVMEYADSLLRLARRLDRRLPVERAAGRASPATSSRSAADDGSDPPKAGPGPAE